MKLMIDFGIEYHEYWSYYGREKVLFPDATVRHSIRYLMDRAGVGTAWCRNKEIRSAIELLVRGLK